MNNIKNFIKKLGTKRIIAAAVATALVATGTIAFAQTSAYETEKNNASNTASVTSLEETSVEENNIENDTPVDEVSGAVTTTPDEQVTKDEGTQVKNTGTTGNDGSAKDGSVTYLAREVSALITYSASAREVVDFWNSLGHRTNMVRTDHIMEIKTV